MRTIGGLKDLRRVMLTSICLVTGEETDKLTPAIVTVMHNGQQMSLSGMVKEGIKAGRKDQEGRKVISIVRKDVTVALRENKSGVLFMDGTVGGTPNEGWMDADAILAAKEAEREKSSQEVNNLDAGQTKAILGRHNEVMERWDAIRQARERARAARLKRHVRAS